MKQNVGTTDRVLRILIGLSLLSAAALVEGSGRWLGLIGVIPLLTGLMGNCPAYSLFGFSSCPAPKPKR